MNLDDLAQFESDDAELVPDILPAHARLSIRGPASDLVWLFERAAAICPTPEREVVSGTAYALLEGVPGSDSSLPYVRITASDGEQTISVRARETTVLMPGQVLLPPKKILEVLKNTPEPLTRVEVIGETATIRSGRAVWNIQVPSGDSLALLTQSEGIPTHEVPSGPFKAALRTARKAASASNGRPALGQLEIRDGFITGCDGGRIHRAWLDGVPEDLTLSIPIKVADQLIVALSYSTEPKFEIGANDYTLVFRIGNDSIIAQRMLVPFPENITSLLLAPALTNTDHLTVNREDLVRVVQRVRINSDPDYSNIFLTLQPEKKDKSGQTQWTLAVRARDRIGNAAQELLACQFTGTGKARELCVNHRYLTELLLGYDQETVIFKVGLDTKSQKHPLLIEDREQGFQGLVQQMRADHLM